MTLEGSSRTPFHDEQDLESANLLTSHPIDSENDLQNQAKRRDQLGDTVNPSHEHYEMEGDVNRPDLEMYADSPSRIGTFGGANSPVYNAYSGHTSRSSSLLARLRRISDWMDGPSEPRNPHISLILPSIQQFPIKLWSRWQHSSRLLALWLFLGLWSIIFYCIVSNSILAIPKVDNEPIHLINCGTTFHMWRGKNELCGVDAIACGAMNPDMKDFVFKCPAHCFDDSHIWSYTAVGDYQAIYQPYAVGGGEKGKEGYNIYRADSFVCAATIHHGYQSNNEGKIGRIVAQGPQSNFVGSKGHSGVESIGFDGWFPQSYSIDDDFPNQHKLSGGHDLRNLLVAFNILLSLIFGYFAVDGLVFYWVMMIMGFWTVALGSNPPIINSDVSSEVIISELISVSFRRFLPFMMGAYVVWRCSGQGVLLNIQAHLSKAVFWVPGFWITLMENYTFTNIPINRLMLSDIKQQGGFIALFIIVGIIASAATGQAVVIWRMGKFKKYITIYLLMILGLVTLGSLHNQNLRLHHYIIGLLLLPGVGFPTTMGLLYQGLLCGLFVSGVARWDFDSIIQTAIQLNRGDALNYGGLPEFIGAVFKNDKAPADVVLQWYDIAREAKRQGEYLNTLWNGYSLIVNDVEVYRGNATEFSLKQWISHAAQTTSIDSLKNIYVRIAFANLTPNIAKTGDYTKAGIINLVTGKWLKPAPGPS